MEKDFLKGVIENILLVSEERVRVSQLENLFDESVRLQEIEDALKELKEEYQERSYKIVQVAGGYLLATNQRYRQYVEDYLKYEKTNRFSNAAMEVLAIISYKQPVTRVEIEHIRGVDSSHIVRGLVDKKLVKPVGKKDVPGKPILFGTTDGFLKHFGLNSLKDLKKYKDFEELIASDVDENESQLSNEAPPQ